MRLRASVEARLRAFWHRPLPPAARAAAPLESLYLGLSRLRRRRAQAQRGSALAVPVIVVGNITVGGTGKTPLVIALAAALRAAGLRVGVVSRGHGGSAGREPAAVPPDGDPAFWGDEAVLLAARIDGPVWIGRDRARAARALCARCAPDVILADDGLQHHRLPRAMEICVVDGLSGLGNGHCLPLGPLREPPARLAEVDFVVANGSPLAPCPRIDGVMRLAPRGWTTVADARDLPLAALVPGTRVHAVAGIGNPARFFATLHALGLQAVGHAFPDHHRFQPRELRFADEGRVVMTEKDAVKCRRFAAPDWLALRVEAELPDNLVRAVLERVAAFSPR
jgi:tetraacyldisaccharide 4'-kinase